MSARSQEWAGIWSTARWEESPAWGGPQLAVGPNSTMPTGIWEQSRSSATKPLPEAQGSIGPKALALAATDLTSAQDLMAAPTPGTLWFVLQSEQSGMGRRVTAKRDAIAVTRRRLVGGEKLRRARHSTLDGSNTLREELHAAAGRNLTMEPSRGAARTFAQRVNLTIGSGSAGSHAECWRKPSRS